MIWGTLRKLAALAGATAALMLAAPVAAQNYSDGYKLLQAVEGVAAGVAGKGIDGHGIGLSRRDRDCAASGRRFKPVAGFAGMVMPTSS